MGACGAKPCELGIVVAEEEGMKDGGGGDVRNGGVLCLYNSDSRVTSDIIA